ncbi:NAD(P)/FAD-dependent oxidoreductase [Streptomyces sp. NPDC088763]|uniref:NAD(P)/FAD-dependent oxidoreductase n=1 Tax=Streptomyces sp. NPDC088763 TaxID=3365892 RepID=UPI0037FFDA30
MEDHRLRNGKPVILVVHPSAVRRGDIITKLKANNSSNLHFVGAGTVSEAKQAIQDLALMDDYSRNPNEWLMAVMVPREFKNFSGERALSGVLERDSTTLKVLLVEDFRTPIPSGFERFVMQEDEFDRWNLYGDALDGQLRELFDAWNPAGALTKVKGGSGTDRLRDIQDMLYRGGERSGWVDNGRRDITVEIRGEVLPLNPSLSDVYAKLCGFPKRDKPEERYDLVVVGAGPTGLAAALSAGLIGLKTLVIEQFILGGSAATSINAIEHYLGFPKGLSGNKLARLTLEQMRNQSITDVDWYPHLEAESLAHEGDGENVIHCRRASEKLAIRAGIVILACGQSPRHLQVDDDSERKFSRRGVHHVALRSHRESEHNKDIVIVGGGDTAGQTALMFLGIAKSITLVSRDPLSTYMHERLLEKVRHASRKESFQIKERAEVVRFLGSDDALTHVLIRDLQKSVEVSCHADSAFVLIGGKPNTDWLRSSGIALDGKDCILTDVHLRDVPNRGDLLTAFAEQHGRAVRTFETNLPGVFAVGDVRAKSFRRVAQAAGQGAAVIASIEQYLRDSGDKVLRNDDSDAYILYGPSDAR